MKDIKNIGILMILITFTNNETLQVSNRLLALIHIQLLRAFGIRVVKLRCSETSDYMAIQDYIELLNSIAKT